LAVRLLIEGEVADAVTRVTWLEKLVDEYVNEGIVRGAIAKASAFDGVRRERELVVIEIFKAWTLRVSPAHGAIANLMWQHIASLGANFPATFHASTDVGRHALQALKELAERRPEWRQVNAQAVGRAVVQKLLSSEEMWGQAAALEAAREYADAFDEESLGAVIDATVAMLAQVDPARDVWPLVRPALTFLVAGPTTAYARKQEDVGRQILGAILRFGIGQDSEQIRVFFYLHDFGPDVLRDPVFRERLAGPLAHARRGALEIQSSRVTESISALLLAPAVSGYDGIHDALEGISRVLNFTEGKRESIGLHMAYDPVLLLVEQYEEIRACLPERLEWFSARMEEIARLVARLWKASVGRPLLFASFSIPPNNKPNPVIVHNWAFAAMRLATIAGGEEIEAALSIASHTDLLGGSISLARAATAAATTHLRQGPETVRADGREAFYAALGRRLALVVRMDGVMAVDMVKALLEGCLRFGPREMDAGVLLEAARLRLRGHAQAVGLSNYARRLTGREERLALVPIVELLSEPA
jgi:hypothetical protein